MRLLNTFHLLSRRFLSTTNQHNAFRHHAAQIMDGFRQSFVKYGIDRRSLEAGHRLVAARTTLLTRLSLETAEHPIPEIKNDVYIRFTTHPTEGQNLRAIREKDSLVKLATATNEVQVKRIAKQHKISDLLANSDLSALRDHVRQKLIDSFVGNPIHHVTKMTVQDERDLLLYHMDRCRKEVAKLGLQDRAKFSSWAFDMDGKPHVQPGNGAIFEFQSQQKFFESLIEMLEDAGLAKVAEEIAEMSYVTTKKILVGESAKEMEEEILRVIFGAPPEIENYVRSSGCKTAEVGFTTREEVSKTNAAVEEIKNLCGEFEPRLVAEKFSALSAETKRQLMCLMESALLHPKHEHIISQFDCELTSYKNTLALFELARQLPEYHERIAYFRDYYAEKSKEAGFDLYKQFFSDRAIARAKHSLVELSPLAEDEKTIPRLVEFTREMLADPECRAYIQKSGGLVRQTRSNSDGSSSLGAQKVVISYLEADIAIKKLVEERGFKLAILQGIGANDLERMAPWRIELLQNEFTAQGSDAQHQTRSRLIKMLSKAPDSSPQQLLTLKEKYPDAEISELVDHYYQAHRDSEFGDELVMNGKKVFTGNLVHRGLIPAAAVKALGKLSSRPDNRTGETKAAALRGNDYDVWDASVYNNDMRRIGAISLQRISSLSTFSVAPFFNTPKSDPKLVADFTEIPLIQNINFSAIFALGVADIKSFMLVNGFDVDLSDQTILETAKQPNSSSPEEMRCIHTCRQIAGCRNVLRNAITPLIHKASKQTQDAAEKIFREVENNHLLQKYDRPTIRICEIFARDQQLDLETRQTLACVAQQIANVHKKGNYYDTRADLISGAHDASKKKDEDGFKNFVEWLATITRSAGNPVRPMRCCPIFPVTLKIRCSIFRPYFQATATNMKLINLLALLALSSCSTTIKNFDSYQKQFLSKTKFMPSQENLAGKAPKVVVFALEQNENEVAKQAGLGDSLANNIENILSKNRLGEIVDRKAAAKLQKEIQLAEMNKTGSYKGPIVADYAVSGAVSNAGFTSKYVSGSTYFNPRTQQMVSVPPKYSYLADVAGNIKIYELPSLTVAESVEFSAKKSRSEAVQQKGGVSLGGLQIGGEKVEGTKRDDSLVRKAGEDAVNDAETDIKNFFAKKGYILEKRVLDNKTIFKISLGSSDGIKQDDKFEVMGQYETENALTNQIEVERRIIAMGTVSDLVDPKTSWVVIDDAKKAEAIRLGDSVKMKYQKSRFAAVTKVATSMLEQ